MSNVTKLSTVRRERRQAKASGMTLCRSGFHQWQVVKDHPFSVRQGGLVTFERCERCGKERGRSA